MKDVVVLLVIDPESRAEVLEVFKKEFVPDERLLTLLFKISGSIGLSLAGDSTSGAIDSNRTDLLLGAIDALRFDGTGASSEVDLRLVID